jgi:hypothetical protein
LQARYGWTDKQIAEIPFSRYLKKLKIAAEKYNQRRAEESASAFSLATMAYYFTGPEMSFKKYLNMLGLTEIEQPKSEDKTKKEEQNNIEKSKNIIRNIDFGKGKRGE